MLFGLAGVGAVAGLLGWRLSRATAEAAIAMVIHKRLAYLQLDATGVLRFARELAAKNDIAIYKLRTIAAAGRLYSDVSYAGHNKIANAIREGKERIVTIFLLSSDFFLMGADEARVVQYLDLYDAMRACSNPFARPVAPQSA